jgi:hypothetical protein
MISALGGIKLITRPEHIHSPITARTSDERMGFSGETISCLCGRGATKLGGNINPLHSKINHRFTFRWHHRRA